MSEVNIHRPGDSDITPVTVSDLALKHIKKQLQKHENGIGVRLSVKKAGCSGLRYELEFVASINPTDYQFPAGDELSVFVAADSIAFLKGTCLDLKKEGLNEKLIYRNPNEEAACGCGESFSVIQE